MDNRVAAYIDKEFREIGMILSSEQVGKFEKLYYFMIEYNKNVNLTAITEYKDVADKHFIDSVLPFKLLNIAGGESFIDVGTGAGFPALPLLIAYPELHGTLCDSLAKRCVYLEKACAQIGAEAEIIHARGEELARKRREEFDIATARAVAAMPVLTELCLPFVRVGGRFVALKSVNEDMSAANNAVKTLGGVIERTTDYSLPSGAGERRVCEIKKISQTPTKYPRSCANITKKPL